MSLDGHRDGTDNLDGPVGLPQPPRPAAVESVRSAVGRWVILRPVLPPDYPVLYSWAADLRSLYLWSFDRRVPSYQDFVARVENSLRETQSYLIAEKSVGTPIGFCQGYDMNLAEGWASFLLYVVEGYRKRPHPAEAGIILLDILFKYFPLRKVYADVFEYNEDSFDILVNNGGFREEARLPNHIWYEDRYWAVIKLALYREDYYLARERFARIAQIQHDFNSLMAARSETATTEPHT
ncbi:MAG: GNAT family protein [Dehalococcoidia bacterium]